MPLPGPVVCGESASLWVGPHQACVQGRDWQEVYPPMANLAGSFPPLLLGEKGSMFVCQTDVRNGSRATPEIGYWPVRSMHPDHTKDRGKSVG